MSEEIELDPENIESPELKSDDLVVENTKSEPESIISESKSDESEPKGEESEPKSDGSEPKGDDFTTQLDLYIDKSDYNHPSPGEVRKGVIISISPQGVIVDLGLKRDGFVPPNDLSLLSAPQRDALKVDEDITVIVLKAGNNEDSIQVSISKAAVIEDWKQAEKLKESGEITKVRINGYNKGGVTVPFGGLRGFIPLSHVPGFSRGMDEGQRQRKLAKLAGQEVPVKVIEVDQQKQRLVLSQREAQKEWDEANRKSFMATLEKGSIIKGRVRGLRPFGAFISLGGADGLIHVSELAWHRVLHPRDVLKMGEEIEVYVLSVDPEKGRISLSRKPLLSNPWDDIEAHYKTGTLLEGRVIRLTDFGAFVELEPGVEGLLHITQLSRSPVASVDQVVAEGERHLLRVINVDPKRRRIGLSLKSVSASEQINWMTAQAAKKEEEEAKAAAAAAKAEAKAAAKAEAKAAKAEAKAAAAAAKAESEAAEAEAAAKVATPEPETPTAEVAESTEAAAPVETAPVEEVAPAEAETAPVADANESPAEVSAETDLPADN